MVGTLGVIIAAAALVVAFMSQKQKAQFVNWITLLVTHPVYLYRCNKFWYCTKIYLAESKQANERGYVYVGKRRKLLCDIHWKFLEWSEAIRIKLSRIADAQPKNAVPNELGVIQILAVYSSQSRQ